MANTDALESEIRKNRSLAKEWEEGAKKAGTMLKTTQEKLSDLSDRYSDLASPNRALLSGLGGLLVGGVVTVTMNALVGKLASYSMTSKNYADFIKGGTNLVGGAAIGGIALAMRGKNPGIGDDIALSAGVTEFGLGATGMLRKWWSNRQAAQQAAKDQADKLASLQAAIDNAQAAQAAAAAQQQPGQGQ